MTEINNTNIASATTQQNLGEIQSDADGMPPAQSKGDTRLDKLQRIRELAVRAAKVTTSDNERLALQSKVNKLIAEVNQAEDKASAKTEND